MTAHDPLAALPAGAVRRAGEYAAIFLNIGDRWTDFVPVDAQVVDDRVYIQGVQLWQESDAWHIGDGDGGHWAFQSAAGAS